MRRETEKSKGGSQFDPRCFVRGAVSHSSDWPQTLHVAKDDFDLLILQIHSLPSEAPCLCSYLAVWLEELS